MKKIILFKNTDEYEHFGNYEAREKISKVIDNMERDDKTYMITIEEVGDCSED